MWTGWLTKISGLMSAIGGVMGGNQGEPEPVEKDWFDRWVDRFNRLLRPLMLIGFTWLLVWPMYDPTLAQRWAEVIKIYPDPLWTLIILVIVSVISSKAIRDMKTRYYSGFTMSEDMAPDPTPAGIKGQFDNFIDPSGPLGDGNNPTLDAWKNRKGA